MDAAVCLMVFQQKCENMATAQQEDDRTDQPGDVETWLLRNRQYIRSIRDAGDGSYHIVPPKRVLDDHDIDDGDDVVVLPHDLTEYLDLERDPLLLVYELPLEP